MLTNRYLKYNPSITLEVFTKIWNKLYEKGWKRENNKSFEYSYTEFTQEYSYLVDIKDKEFNFYLTKNGTSFTEITVQEILNPISENLFYKDDYIVTLDSIEDYSDCAKNNYCFKIRMTAEGIYPYTDLEGNTQNGNKSLKADKSSNLRNWRYATDAEINYYNQVNKPFDVTILYIPNVYDLKIGIGYSDKILTKWAHKSNCFYSNKWKSITSSFSSNRVITKFDIKEGISCFAISGTCDNIYLKCEGFKEFVESELNLIKINNICTKYKVGDKVKIISNGSYKDVEYYINEIWTIYKLNYSINHYIEKDGRYTIVSPHEFELYTSVTKNPCSEIVSSELSMKDIIVKTAQNMGLFQPDKFVTDGYKLGHHILQLDPPVKTIDYFPEVTELNFD